MTSTPWVLAIGDAAPEEDMAALLSEAEEYFETEIGLLTDLGPESGLDWAITGLAFGRRVRALMPWAPYEDANSDVRGALIDEVEDVDYFFEGDQASWTKRTSSYEAARGFTLWQLMGRADMVIVFYSGQPSEFLRRMAAAARARRAIVWGYDLESGTQVVWYSPETKKTPMEAR